MAGHSKWANIKHKKQRADAKKGKIFSRIAKEIITAVRHGDPDPKNNPRLRLALQKAKSANMPAVNIERNIKKAASQETADYFEMTYEIYGFGGVGLIIEVMTDNKNRIASEMRIATNKRGGSVATPGSVAFNFEQKGVIHIASQNVKSEDELFLLVTDAGAEDFQQEDEEYLVITAVEMVFSVRDQLEEAGVMIDDAGLEMRPKTKIDCDEQTAKANLALIEWLEDLDDVDAVYHNME